MRLGNDSVYIMYYDAYQWYSTTNGTGTLIGWYSTEQDPLYRLVGLFPNAEIHIPPREQSPMHQHPGPSCGSTPAIGDLVYLLAGPISTRFWCKERRAENCLQSPAKPNMDPTLLSHRTQLTLILLRAPTGQDASSEKQQAISSRLV